MVPRNSTYMLLSRFADQPLTFQVVEPFCDRGFPYRKFSEAPVSPHRVCILRKPTGANM